MENSFQYTTPSNSSAAYFPSNKPNEFQVKLPHPIALPGEWELALVDIQYHTAWLTLEQPQHFILRMLPEETQTVHLLNYEGDASLNFYLLGIQSSFLAQESKWSISIYRPFNSVDKLATIIALPAAHYDSISDCVYALNH